MANVRRELGGVLRNWLVCWAFRPVRVVCLSRAVAFGDGTAGRIHDVLGFLPGNCATRASGQYGDRSWLCTGELDRVLAWCLGGTRDRHPVRLVCAVG